MTSIRFVTGKSSGILSDISSGILSGTSSGILSGISSGILRVRGVTCPKIYELTPPHGTPLTPRPQELTPCANHHGTPALTDRFLDWFAIFLRDLVHFTSVREFFDLTPNVKERMAHLQIVFYQPKFSDVSPIVGTTYLISKNVIHDGFPHWHTEYIQVLR